MKISGLSKSISIFAIMLLFAIVFFACKRPSGQDHFPPASFYDQKIDTASRLIEHGSYDEAFLVITRITPHDDSLLALSYQQLLDIYILNGRLYKLVDQYDSAMSYLLKAKRLAVAFSIKRDRAKVNIQLAELHRVLSEPLKANEILRETSALLEDIPENYPLLALMYNRCASVGTTPDSVEYFSLKALEYARKTNDKNLIATSLNELGYIYRPRGFEPTMSYYRQAIRLWRETGNRHEELNTLINIAQMYYGFQKHTVALMTLDTVRQILGTEHLLYIEQMYTIYSAQNYQKLGNYDSAFYYLNKHFKNAFRDVKSQQVKKAKQLEYAEEMANGKYLAELKEKELVNTKRMNGLIILTVLLAFLFGLVLFFSNKRLRKMNLEINRQNNKIHTLYNELQQHHQRSEALYQELHHRVVSNLALLRDIFLEHRMITTNPLVNELLDSSINRLSSIEKIHQLVFGGGVCEEINGRQYLQSLGYHVLNLQQETKRADFELVCPDEISFSPKFTQFFGMIFSELLMNSMKHARVGQHDLICNMALKTDENHLHVIYHDNGKPVEGGEAGPETGENVGFYLIHTLTKQLAGDCRFEMERGFIATFIFDKNRLLA